MFQIRVCHHRVRTKERVRQSGGRHITVHVRSYGQGTTVLKVGQGLRK